MKVLIAIPSLLWGGTEIQTLNLVNSLIFLNHEVTVMCYFEYDDKMVQKFTIRGAKIQLLKYQRKINLLSLIIKLHGEICKNSPDVIHVQYIAPGALPIIAARLAGVRKVFATVHQPYTKSLGWKAKFLLRSASIFTSRFISVSQNAEISWFGNSCLFNEAVPLSDQPSHFTIYNTVDSVKVEEILSSSDKIKLRNEHHIATDRLIIGTVSRLRYEKGVDILIDAYAELLTQYQNIHLLIVGDGPEMNNLVKQAGEKGIHKQVTFFGMAEWITAIQLIGLMDIVVVPSRFEGFGLTAAEAMAAGKPLIASDSFGLKEVVKNEETGLLFKSEDSKMLKDKLLKLCKDRDLMSTYGLNGRSRCESLFGMRLFRKKLSNLYC